MAAAPVDPVVAAIAAEDIGPVGAQKGVVAGLRSAGALEPVDDVVVGPGPRGGVGREIEGHAGGGVVIRDVIRPRPAVVGVGAAPGADIVIAAAQLDDVVARAVINPVLTRPAADRVVPGPAVDRVVAVAARQRIVARAAFDPVVAAITAQGVGAPGAQKDIVAGLRSARALEPFDDIALGPRARCKGRRKVEVHPAGCVVIRDVILAAAAVVFVGAVARPDIIVVILVVIAESDKVIARAVRNAVVAQTTGDAVVARPAGDVVGAAVADQRVIAAPAHHIRDMGGRGRRQARGDGGDDVGTVRGQRDHGAAPQRADQPLIGPLEPARDGKDGDDVRAGQRLGQLRDLRVVFVRVEGCVAVVGACHPAIGEFGRGVEIGVREQDHDPRGVGLETDFCLGPGGHLQERLELGLGPVGAAARQHRVIGHGQGGRVRPHLRHGAIDPVARAAIGRDRLVAEGRGAEGRAALHRLQRGHDLGHQRAHIRDVVAKAAGQVLKELHVQGAGHRAAGAEIADLILDLAFGLAGQVDMAVAFGLAGVDAVAALEILDMDRAAVDLIHIVAGAPGQRVVPRVRDQPVVAIAADQRVVAVAAIQRIVAGVAVQGVVVVVARQAVARAHEAHVFDIVGQRPVAGDDDGVDASARQFHDHVTRVVDVIGIVAQTADHAVGTFAAVQRVVAVEAAQRVAARAAGQAVVQGIAGADAGGAGQRQVFDVGVRFQAEVDGGVHGVGATAGQFDQGVGGGVHQVMVIPRAAFQRVDAARAVQRVGPGAAAHEVVQGVAGAAMRGAGQDQGFDMRGQRVGAQIIVDGGDEAVVALIGQFLHHVARIVDMIRVVALAADHRVGACPPVEHVVAGGADNLVGQRVAGAPARGAGQFEAFDIRGQGVVHGGNDGIGAVVQQFDHLIQRGIDVVGVVAAQTAQDVVAPGAIEGVVPGGADKGVAQPVPRGPQRRPGQGEVLDLGAQRPVEGGDNRVDASARGFGDHVACVIDKVFVAALSADHRVVARAAVQVVGKGGAGQPVVQRIAKGHARGAGQGQVLDLRRQGPVEAGDHRVMAAARGFGRGVAGVVDPVGIVARAARHGIGAGPAVERVVPAARVDGVVARQRHDVVRPRAHRVAQRGIARADHIRAVRAIDGVVGLPGGRGEQDIGGFARARRADHQVRRAVAVLVTDQRHGLARQAACGADDLGAADALGHQRQVHRAEIGAAPDHIDRACVGPAFGIVRRADDDIGHAVAVQVAPAGEGKRGQIARRFGEDAEPAQTGADIGQRQIAAAVGGIDDIGAVRSRRADQKVGLAVAVDVADGGDGGPGTVQRVAQNAEPARAVGDVGQIDTRRRRLAEHDKDRAVAAIRIGGADHDLGQTVAVQVVEGCDMGADGVARVGADDAEPVGARRDIGKADGRIGRLAPRDIDRPGLGPARVVADGADDDILLAVAVQVGNRQDRGSRRIARGLAPEGIALAPLQRVAQVDAARRRPAADHKGHARVDPGLVLPGGADQQFAQPVAVQVGNGGDRGARQVAGLDPVEDDLARKGAQRAAGQEAMAAELHEDAPGVGGLVIVARGRDGEILDPVAVGIANGREPGGMGLAGDGDGKIPPAIGPEAIPRPRRQGGGEEDLGIGDRHRRRPCSARGRCRMGLRPGSASPRKQARDGPGLASISGLGGVRQLRRVRAKPRI